MEAQIPHDGCLAESNGQTTDSEDVVHGTTTDTTPRCRKVACRRILRNRIGMPAGTSGARVGTTNVGQVAFRMTFSPTERRKSRRNLTVSACRLT
jgi:hypothetical protein